MVATGIVKSLVARQQRALTTPRSSRTRSTVPPEAFCLAAQVVASSKAVRKGHSLRHCHVGASPAYGSYNDYITNLAIAAQCSGHGGCSGSATQCTVTAKGGDCGLRSAASTYKPLYSSLVQTAY